MNMKKFQKKSQSMSLNTVIIAALVILVLIIISIIVIKYMGQWRGNIAECTAQGGQCFDKIANACGEGRAEAYIVPRIDLSCPKSTDACCTKLGT